MAKIDQRCETPECKSSIEKYGAHYRSVHSVDKVPAHMPDATAKCERCGGYSNGAEWKHACVKCGAAVAAGGLVGLFVPSRCKACDDVIVAQERASGRVCGRCRDVMSRCCC